MKIHDRIVSALVLVHNRIRVKSNDEKIAELLCFFQEVEMTDMEQIEGAGNVNNLVARVW